MDKFEAEQIVHSIRAGIAAYREKSRFPYADDLSSLGSPPAEKKTGDSDFRLKKAYIIAVAAVIVAAAIGFLYAKSQQNKSPKKKA